MGTRLFTGSFDTTMKVWDISDLFPEKGSGARERQKKLNAEPVDEEEDVSISYQKGPKSSQNSRLTVENEKSFMSQNQYSYSGSGSGSGYPKSADQRSEADSGIDDPYGGGYNGNRSARPRRFEIKEMV